MDISSENVVFNRLNVNSKGFSAILENDNTNVKLYGSVTLNSEGGKAVVCRNINLSEVDPAISSSMSVTGNIYVCGSIEGQRFLSVTNGNIIQISEEEFEKYAQGCFEVSFDANGGAVDTAAKTVYYGSEYGELPEAERNYFSFLGWYTAAEGGTHVTENTIFEGDNNITLYAHWMQNPESGWVLEGNVPAGAAIVNEKWTYDETFYTTSSSSSLDGWTQYNSTWEWGAWGSWSGYSRTQYSSSDSRQVESRTVTDQGAYTSYKYWIYRTPDGYGYGTQGYNTGSHGSCTIYDEININYQLSCVNSSLGLYGYYDSSKFSHSYDNQWFYSGSTYHPAVTHNEWRYRDRSKVYTYYYSKVESKEAFFDPTGQNNVSGVQRWVTYRNK